MILGDTYELMEPIGRGGGGTVWLAQHRRLPKLVAIKLLSREARRDAEACARFRREADIAAKLQHPNIVEVLDINDLPDGSPYIVLELLRGENLAAEIRRGAMTLARAVDIIGQVVNGLDALHRHGVIHRDLKPQNVFLARDDDDEETVKVLDFGVSKVIGSTLIRTEARCLLGTPEYMAPEQITGHNELVDARTDVFALGVIAHEMLTGSQAFAGDTLVDTTFRIVRGPTPSMRRIRRDLPAHTYAAVERALAKDPAGRFDDVRSFFTALSGRGA
jgi:serine/threonine-protein kinase